MRLIVSIVVLVAVTYLLSSGVLAARCRLAYCPADATVSCFSKIQIGFTFLVLAHPGSPGQMAVKRACVCVCALVAVDTSSKPTGRLCYTFVYSVRTGRKRLPFSPKTSGGIARGWTDKLGTWKTV